MLVERLSRVFALPMPGRDGTLEERVAEIERRLADLQVESTLQGLLAQRGRPGFSMLELVKQIEEKVTLLEQERGYH